MRRLSGETLAGFWSSGYASPEQRAALPTGPESDLFSLGAVFFHLLSSQEPPPEGPSRDMVDEFVDHPLPIRNVLKRMLSQDPKRRSSRGSELVSALDVTRRHEALPSHFLVLTQTALRDVLAAGLSLTEDFQSVADVIIEDLGGMELEEVHIRRDRRDSRDVTILGDTLRLICGVDEQGDALAVKAVQTPYVPILDGEKGRSMELSHDYFQDWLSEDQKAAVSKAVSSNELFLIQGPPGTGKTSVITEIVLQILKREPEARILLTSQSNVAVDHALTQIANAAGDFPPEMVRLGRSEKIGHGGESWTLSERARAWRQEVLDRCQPEIAKLRSEERQVRDTIKVSEPEGDPDMEAAGNFEEWITEANEIADQLQQYEQEYSLPPLVRGGLAQAISGSTKYGTTSDSTAGNGTR